MQYGTCTPYNLIEQCLKTYNCALGKLVTQMMIYDKRLGLWIIDDPRATSATLVEHYHKFRFFR